MKSKLIRILIVFCFVGMVVFGVVVFLSNFNVEAKVYSEITTIKNNTKFDSLYKSANSVKPAYTSSSVCPYVDYANDAIKYLNEGIDYYLYYFQDMSGMNKNQKDKIVKAYKEYIAKINTAKATLVKYESFESKQSPTANDQRNMAAASAKFAMDYLNAFAKGYEVFVMLQDTVNQKVFDGKMYKSFTQIEYEMAVNFVNNSVNKVVGLLESKAQTGDQLVQASPYTLTTTKNPKNFNLLYDYSKLTDGYEFRDQNHAKFVSNYNKISDPKAFFADSSTYSAENPDESMCCTAIKTFLSSTYGIMI